MINEEKLNLSCDDPTVASITLSGMLFRKFMEENKDDLWSDYVDYLNSIGADDEVDYPFYCYAVFNKCAVEAYLETLDEDGLRSDS